MTRAWLRRNGWAWNEEVEVIPGTTELMWQGRRIPAFELPLTAPVSGTVYGVALNDAEALARLDAVFHGPPYNRPPQAPVLYIKPANTVIGPDAPIPVPDGVEQLTVAPALGAVFGRTAARVDEQEALAYVLGYTIVLDVSVPRQDWYRPAVAEQARDGFCPIGPWIVESTAVANPNQLRVEVFVDGERRLAHSTASAVRTLPRLISEVTSFMTLYPGDVLLAGVPADAPLVRAGQRVRAAIEGVGVLENPLVAESQAAAHYTAADARPPVFDLPPDGRWLP
ncbi:fumarylacetoacetate hydrolase family protein [Alicyclobacillus shizuokensis]|uniref:fumarylacetoacetate hydrolase family protein n=1 Tax=Alicyclobacillus shizuokensis TaxID=392014 RepID=UPI000833F9FF|nr:fumarylacetoacetate hydrolase family protein [Alicyclobacillus shizuokensis]